MWEASPMAAPVEPRTSFDVDPDRYARARPTYPGAHFDVLFERIRASRSAEDQNDGAPIRVIEVGPGTGQATTELVARADHVTAAEPGANFAERLRRTHPSVEVHHGDFEAVTVAPGSFDAVVSATSYHWIRRAARLDRPLELLRPGGWLAVIDLVQVGDPVDRGYFERVQPMYASFGDHRHDWSPPVRGQVVPSIASEAEASDRFDEVEVIEIDWNQTYSSAEYRDLLMTYSGTLTMEPDPQRQLVDQLVAVIDDEYDGVLVRPLVAALTLARTR